MSKRKKLIITREGYIFLAAVGVLLLALIIVAVATKGFGACNKNAGAAASASRRFRVSSRSHGCPHRYTGTFRSGGRNAGGGDARS